MHLGRAFETIALLAALRTGGRARAERVITANPSAGHHVHYENTAKLNLKFPPDLTVNSNVPVTLQRYSDSGSFFDGQKPIHSNEATVVVKSDCSTDDTDVIPQVEISEDGLIKVLVSGVDGIAGSDMPFLDEPSYYSVFWTWVDDFCGGGGFFTPPATVLPVETEEVPTEEVPVIDPSVCVIPGTAGIRICNEGEYCMQEVGVCADPSGPPSGECTAKTQLCAEIWDPVCGCDARTYSNACDASSNGVSVNYEGGCSTAPPAGGKPAVEVIPPVEEPIIAEVVTIPSTSQEVGLCEQGAACAVEGESCERGSETCCGKSSPSFKCRCVDAGDGILAYDWCLYTDACYVPPCCFDGPPEGLPPPNESTCSNVGGLCDTGIADDYCCMDMDTGGRYCTVSGGKASSASTPGTPATTNAAVTTTSINFIESSGASGGKASSSTPGTPATTDAAAVSTTASTTSIESSDETTVSATVGTAAEISTEAASSVAATTDAQAVTQAPVPASGESTPTQGPTSKQQDSVGLGEVEPSEINSEPDEFSSGFVRRRPSSFYAVFILLAVVALASLFPTSGNGGLMGKFVVVALAVSSQRRRNSGSQKSSNQNKRVLQTCNYNVEIIYDACTHSVNVQAPKTRTVDAVIGDVSRSASPDNECTKELAVNLTFPSTDAEELNGTDVTASQYEQFVSDRCMVIAIGRPFVDSSGSSLVATPYVHENMGSESSFAVSWMGDVSTFPTNSTAPSVKGDYFLVHEWTRRGLAEHASVASFAAFNVALLTNGAPSDLVEDALQAALDEVRHTKASFEVVFKLSGKEAGPGSLPESSLEFTQDIKAMGMAVAREGCLDETLSAFDARMESDHISKLLNGEAIESVYSSIDRDTLTWIRNELRTIGSDESKHAALAWKTLKWLCSGNKDACEDIMADVFDKDAVDQRLRQRAQASLIETSFAFEYMRVEWNRVYAAFRADDGQLDCINSAAPGNSVSSSIIDQVICST